MATGTKKGNAGSGAGVKAGKRRSKAKKAGLRDLDAKDTSRNCRGNILLREQLVLIDRLGAAGEVVPIGEPQN